MNRIPGFVPIQSSSYAATQSWELTTLGRNASKFVRLLLLVVEFHISILAQSSLLQVLPLFPQDVLQRHARIREDLQMIGDQVPVLAFWTRDQRGAEMIGLFGDPMRRPLQALPAGKGDVVRRLLRFARGGELFLAELGGVAAAVAICEWPRAGGGGGLPSQLVCYARGNVWERFVGKGRAMRALSRRCLREAEGCISCLAEATEDHLSQCRTVCDRIHLE